jgi:elongation factor 1-beta
MALKSKKHPRKDQAKSILEFDVKGYEMDQDWNAMATGIRGITMEGVTWMDSHEVVPIAFGMKKLRMKCIIVDDLVATDDVFEKIQETYEDDVQSIDTVSFNKA